MNPTSPIATGSARPFTPRLNRHKGNQRSSAECGHPNSRVSSAALIYNNPTTPYSCCQVVQRMGSTSETHYLWRAVDHEGEVLEVFVTKRRDRRAALKFLKRTMKRYERPSSIVIDRLRSYQAAMKGLGNPGRQECRRWLNNRAENSHQPFRRREGAMARFRDIKTLQEFAAVHASIHNHFNHQRHLTRRDVFKQHRTAALAEWRQLAA